MKILQVNDRYNLQGGTEEYLPYISRKLAERGHQVFVLFAEGERYQNDDRTDIKLVKLRFDDLSELEKLIRELEPDVANLHNIQNPYVVQKISQLVPTIRYIHDHRVFCPGFSKFYLSNETACSLPFSPRCALNAYAKRCATRRPLKLFKKMTAKPFELDVNRSLPKILVASEYMRKELIKNKFDSNKIVVMPDPIELPSGFEIEYGDFILFVGRLTVEKGLKYLLQALAKVPSEIKLKVVGDGPERLENQELVASLKISDRITFTGWLSYPEVCKLYAQCRFLVFPSVWPEPYGRTGPEALSFSKPVIGFNVGAVPEWLKDGENGFLLKPRDIDSLAEKIGYLWHNLTLVKELGSRGRRVVKQRVGSKRYLSALEELYRQLGL